MSGRITRPCSINSGTTRATVLTGMENPTPEFWPVLLAMAVFMPMRWDWLLISGPPELPRFSAASICMIDFMLRPVRDGRVRFKLETIPIVSVLSRPNGFPTAKILWPTRKREESPRGMGNNVSGGASIFKTAMSFAGSWPTRRPRYVLLS